MPEMDGFTVAGALRGPFGAGIYIVALTAHTDEATELRVAGVNFDMYIGKPASIDALLAIVAKLVPGSRLQGIDLP